MFFLQKKIYADPCSILERPQAQLCGSAVHAPREADGSLVSRLGFEGGFFSPASFCVECDYTAARKENLHVHIQSVHEGTHLGERCDYEAARKEDLYEHIRSVHGGIRPCPKK